MSTINGRAGDVYRWLNLRCKLIYGVAHRPAKIAQFLAANSPLKSFAYISAGQPEVDVILFVGHRVLSVGESGTSSRKRKEFTRIMVRRTDTEPKTGFTGVVLVASLATFRPSMAIFNAGMTLPRPFCC